MKDLFFNVPIKVGEIITIKDGSYMLAIDTVSNVLTRSPKSNDLEHSLVRLKHEYVVIAVNVPCPTPRDLHESLFPANNCIIKDLSDNMIWFCSEINIKTKRSL